MIHPGKGLSAPTRRFGLSAVLAVLPLLALAALPGCASVDRITLSSSARLNSCGGADGHPVVLRIYYLRGTSKFARAPFEELWENDLAVLGDDKIRVREETLNPAQEISLQLDRGGDAKEASAIGIVANFCEPGEGCNRRLIPIAGRKTDVRIHADEGCLSID
ncbi:MAG: type VI secretion system lipoprotein TssJ [Gemmatimonadetes bacterium]|nr:type VI secretion system lipoprotein TssJ [Gemmatimonadota bacterium]